MRAATPSLLFAVFAVGAWVQADEQPVAAERPTAACAVTVTVRDPDQYYPPGSLRRAEEGEVVIEFAADPGAINVREVKTLKSSGFPDLDAAALKVAQAMRVSSPCMTLTVRRSIQFHQWRSDETRNVQLGTVEGTVQILPYDD